MVDVLLVYPFFKPRFDRSPFRFPPLGIGYIASFLKQEGFTVKILDCTFKSQRSILEEVENSSPRIIGIYSMYSMERESINLARRIKGIADILVVGGPLPTVDPASFLNDFDLVVIGEAENTMLDLARSFFDNGESRDVPGIVFKDGSGIHRTVNREFITDLDSIPFPARELFENAPYKRYYQTRFGYSMTSMISSRGCPFKCDFCSRPVFGESFRSRSPQNIVDEMQSISALGYDTIWFADDCFTISKKRVVTICDEIMRRGLNLKWQCLSRVDTLDNETASRMKKTGCQRIYFGIESGDETTLQIMRKETDLQTARTAVRNARSAQIQTGAFFIIGYPGESNQAILNTIRFGASLPLDYLSFTLPYPIPGTGLYEKVKDNLKDSAKRRLRLIEHSLLFKSQFSELKLKFAIAKGTVQFMMRKYLGSRGYMLLGTPLEKITDELFRAMK